MVSGDEWQCGDLGILFHVTIRFDALEISPNSVIYDEVIHCIFRSTLRLLLLYIAEKQI